MNIKPLIVSLFVLLPCNVYAQTMWKIVIVPKSGEKEFVYEELYESGSDCQRIGAELNDVAKGAAIAGCIEESFIGTVENNGNNNKWFTVRVDGFSILTAHETESDCRNMERNLSRITLETIKQKTVSCRKVRVNFEGEGEAAP